MYKHKHCNFVIELKRLFAKGYLTEINISVFSPTPMVGGLPRPAAMICVPLSLPVTNLQTDPYILNFYRVLITGGGVAISYLGRAAVPL